MSSRFDYLNSSSAYNEQMLRESIHRLRVKTLFEEQNKRKMALQHLDHNLRMSTLRITKELQKPLVPKPLDVDILSDGAEKLPGSSATFTVSEL